MFFGCITPDQHLYLIIIEKYRFSQGSFIFLIVRQHSTWFHFYWKKHCHLLCSNCHLFFSHFHNIVWIIFKIILKIILKFLKIENEKNENYIIFFIQLLLISKMLENGLKKCMLYMAAAEINQWSNFKIEVGIVSG